MIKILKNLGKKEWILALIAFVLILSQVWLELKIPDYMSEITVLVQTEGSAMSDILKKRWTYDTMCFWKLIYGNMCRISNFNNIITSFKKYQKKFI